MEDTQSNAATGAKQERKAWKQQTNARACDTQNGRPNVEGAWNCHMDYVEALQVRQFCHNTANKSYVVGERTYLCRSVQI